MQNKTNTIALKYSEKIENLRLDFLKVFKLSETHLISFQPNQWFIDRLVFNFLAKQKILSQDATVGGNKKKKFNIYTNEREEVFRALKLFADSNSISIYSLENLLFIEGNELSERSLIWITDREECYLREIERKLREFKELYSFYSLSKKPPCLGINLKIDLSLFSFISYDPADYFEEFGTIFFAFKKNLNLTPVYIGSGVASLLNIGRERELEFKNLQLKELPYSLEFGTQNLVSLLALAVGFRELV